jgi:hypothetical protein
MDMALLAENKVAVAAIFFLVFFVWESYVPVAPRSSPYKRRWLINYAL